jgi:hypothetical protein
MHLKNLYSDVLIVNLHRIYETYIIFALHMDFRTFLLVITVCISMFSCQNKTTEPARQQLLEVEGKFLYFDQIQDIIPPNVSKKDSAVIADSYVRKWVTDVLLYENAKRNITNKEEIELLLEDYRKSLIIHQYQQKLLQERLPKEPKEEDIRLFYEKYKNQLILKENLIQGILLITPANAPQLDNVRSWVQFREHKST